jgi:hypothetical protein
MDRFGKTEGTEMRFDLTDMRLFLTVVEQDGLTKGVESNRNGIFAWRALLERNRRGVTTTAAGDLVH